MEFPTASMLHWTSDSFAGVVKTAVLHPAVRAYVANLRRSLLTHELLDYVTHSTALHERARYWVRMEALKRPFNTADDGQLALDSIRAAAKAEWKGFRPLPFPGEQKVPDDPLEPGDREDILASVMAYAGGQSILQGTLENQITNTWTAVESLYRRLCQEACSVRNQNLPSPATVIDPEGLRFASLKSTRASYKKVFAPDAIPNPLNDPALDILSSLRHVLEHNAGYCDPDYLQRATIYPALPWAALGDKVALNGVATLVFVQAVIPVAERLIHEVDDWIQGKI